MKKSIKRSIVAISLLVGVISIAGAGILDDMKPFPHTFSAGKVAKASEVNENFQTVNDNFEYTFETFYKTVMPRVAFSKGYNVPNDDLSNLPAYTIGGSKIVLSTVTMEAPYNGYMVVSSSGKGCVHTNLESIIMILLDGTQEVENFDWKGEGGICGVGESKSYAFHYVKEVVSGNSYTFDIVGYRHSTNPSNPMSGNITIGDLTVVFYPDVH